MNLPAGVRLHLIHETKFKTIRVQLRFLTAFEPRQIAARVLLSNLMEAANADYKTPQAIQERLASMYGATFSSDVVRKGAQHQLILIMSLVNPKLVAEDTLSEGLEFLHSVIFKPLWDEELFTIEKTNLLHYLASSEDDNDYVAGRRLRELFYGTWLPAEGDLESVEATTLEDVRSAYERLLASDLTDIFILGNVEEADLTETLATWTWPSRTPATLSIFDTPQKPMLSNLTEVTEHKEAYQSVLALAWKLPIQYGDKDYMALQVMNGLFGAMPHSKLFKIAREERSLAYEIGSAFDSWSGLFRVMAGIDAADAKATRTLILELLAQVADGDFDESDLADTKKMLKNGYYMSLDNAGALIEHAFTQSQVPERFLDKADFLVQLAAVTSADVQKVARKLQLQVVYLLEGITDTSTTETAPHQERV
ncbi:MAG: insulinase family protein [Streptococcaceae bacterium]|jgi:predicted Zn-dependent peptidase|nr:insulinase family protein [Streptococcaceae bacterium]